MAVKRSLCAEHRLQSALQKRRLHTSSSLLRLTCIHTNTDSSAPHVGRDVSMMQIAAPPLQHLRAYTSVDCADWLLTSWQQMSSHASSSSLVTSSPAYKRCLDEAEKCCSLENKEGTSFATKDLPFCQLCSSVLTGSYSSHQSSVEHQSRVGILERSIALLNYYLVTIITPEEAQGRDGDFVDVPLQLCSASEMALIRHRAEYVNHINWPQRLMQRWRQAIDNAPEADFGRVRQLSAAQPNQRLWRLRYLLRYLVQIKVLPSSLDIQWGETERGFSARAVATEPAGGGFRRSSNFERLELVGDNIFKTMVPNRLQLLFPPVEGGVSPKLSLMQQLLDSNAGLIAIYDFLRLNEIVGVVMPNSKSKADVVEALIGELQTFVWAGECHQQGTPYACVDGRDAHYVVALVRHTLEELVHLLLLWRLEGTLKTGRRFLEEHTIQAFVRRRGKGTSAPAVGGDELDRKAKAAAQESKLARSPYDVLPLLSPEERYHPQVPPSTFGMENCYYSAHIAPVRASGVQEKQRELSEYPFTAPSRYSEFYGGNGALSLTASRSAYHKKYIEALEVLRATKGTEPENTEDGSGLMRPPICSSPSWKQKEDERRWWQKLLTALEPFRLDASEVQRVMQRKLENTIHQSVKGVRAVHMPDLSTKRRKAPSHVNDRFKQMYIAQNFSVSM